MRLAEAQALLTVNQQRRVQAEHTQLLIVVLSFAAGALAFAINSARVLLLLPPTALLLTSLSFQHYVEVTVLGSARARLEQMLNEMVGSVGLLYELEISPVRQRAPLVTGVRLLQGLSRAATATAVVVGFVVVATQRPWVIIAYSLATVAAVASSSLSYCNMRQAERVAQQAFGGSGSPYRSGDSGSG